MGPEVVAGVEVRGVRACCGAALVDQYRDGVDRPAGKARVGQLGGVGVDRLGLVEEVDGLDTGRADDGGCGPRDDTDQCQPLAVTDVEQLVRRQDRLVRVHAGVVVDDVRREVGEVGAVEPGVTGAVGEAAVDVLLADAASAVDPQQLVGATIELVVAHR